VDAFIAVVEPGLRSIQTARTIRRLASDLGVQQVYVVGNKVRSEDDEAFIREQLPEMDVLGFLPTDDQAIEADRQGVAIFEMAPRLVEAAKQIVDRLAGRQGPD
jgi:CO dehydrogenase maturation factor